MREKRKENESTLREIEVLRTEVESLQDKIKTLEKEADIKFENAVKERAEKALDVLRNKNIDCITFKIDARDIEVNTLLSSILFTRWLHSYTINIKPINISEEGSWGDHVKVSICDLNSYTVSDLLHDIDAVWAFINENQDKLKPNEDNLLVKSIG